MRESFQSYRFHVKRKIGKWISGFPLPLEEENLKSHPVWKPMHLQPVFRCCRLIGGEVAEGLLGNGLCLPSGTAITKTDFSGVVDVIGNCRK